MPEPLRLIVWTPSETLLDVDPVGWVHVELAEDKRLTIWPGHISMLGESDYGPLRYADGDGEHSMELPPGIVEVQGRTVTVYLARAVGEWIREREHGLVGYERLASASSALFSHERNAASQPADTGSQG